MRRRYSATGASAKVREPERPWWMHAINSLPMAKDPSLPKSTSAYAPVSYLLTFLKLCPSRFSAHLYGPSTVCGLVPFQRHILFSLLCTSNALFWSRGPWWTSNWCFVRECAWMSKQAATERCMSEGGGRLWWPEWAIWVSSTKELLDFQWRKYKRVCRRNR